MDALVGAGASKDNMGFLADGIIDTELSGLAGHGFYWLQFYCSHVKSGKVDGKAKAVVRKLSPVAFRADARHGFAHPAIEKGFAKLIPAARKFGIAGLAVHNSYNAATLGFHTTYLARNGLVAFGFTNSTPAIAPVGGKTPVIGSANGPQCRARFSARRWALLRPTTASPSTAGNSSLRSIPRHSPVACSTSRSRG